MILHLKVLLRLQEKYPKMWCCEFNGWEHMLRFTFALEFERTIRTNNTDFTATTQKLAWYILGCTFAGVRLHP